ncbi:type 2 lanthipeptide synthetase LanM family protein [Mycolicibacterium sp. XJ1819]
MKKVDRDTWFTRAATFEELLSERFEDAAGRQGDAEVAAERLAAWAKSCASGDWALFDRRLTRDGYSMDRARARFTAARRRATTGPEPWIEDASWIRSALCDSASVADLGSGHLPFEHLFAGLAGQARARLWESVGPGARDLLTPTGCEELNHLLVDRLCELCAAPLYERFVAGGRRYATFVGDMTSGGFERLFDDKPILLRLIAVLTRQWLTTAREFVERLQTDVVAVRGELLGRGVAAQVSAVHGGLSDPHRGGRSVLRIEFADGRRVMYKPKDLRVDAVWHALVQRLNTRAPVELRAPRTFAREHYGWAECIEHAPCPGAEECAEFFRRAGAWLALFHCFAGSDVHQENLIAAGDHPVPVDLETLLQPGAAEAMNGPPHAAAHAAATELIADSVAAVGLLPAYGRTADRSVYPVGGMASDSTARTDVVWADVNSDAMRPVTVPQQTRPATNLPLVAGREVGLDEHLDDLIDGFEEYATFLRSEVAGFGVQSLLDGFAGLRIRKVIRPTQFYTMLLGRLTDDRTMDDGVIWSVQADFVARLADWDDDADPGWALRRAERAALLQLDVPYFQVGSDHCDILGADGVEVRVAAAPGLQRARERLQHLDEDEIAWQTTVVRQTASFVAEANSAHSAGQRLKGDPVADPSAAAMAEANAVAAEIARYATRRGTGAAWIGLSWLPDSDVSQLAVVGDDLYNGTSGIALFLAAHAKTAQQPESADLAMAAIAHLRAQLRSSQAARMARLLGIGGTSGLGSVIYALLTMSRLLGDDDLAADAHLAAGLISDDLIAGDRHLDIVGGSAGAILSLLRLYEESAEQSVLNRAVKCGEHLLSRRPSGAPLVGMSHGAAGFAYAMRSLAYVTGRQEFLEAARGWVAVEHADWTDSEAGEPNPRSQWCHGAVGIGLSRLGMARRGGPDDDSAAEIDMAIQAAARAWPGHVDTLCCGSLGGVELLREAGAVLNRRELTQMASNRLSAILANKLTTGDYRWSGGARRFNVGLFRGLAGVGYTCLREIDGSLPNVLIWT